MDKLINTIFRNIEDKPTSAELYSDCFDCIKILFAEDKQKSFEYNKRFRKYLVNANRLST